MNDLTEILQIRIAARGSGGQHLSLLTGSESLEELKRAIIHLCQACPASQNHVYCPFRILSGLSHASMTNLVNKMPMASCLNLFEMELNCRAQG